jgi:NTP pyrophosphatase (non-canonical NTP hydrolase)
MNFETFLQTVLLRAAPLPLEKQEEHALLGMVSEAGELADLYKRQLAYGKDFDKVNLLEECGDWLWYYALYGWCRGVRVDLVEKYVHQAEQMDHTGPTGVGTVLAVAHLASGEDSASVPWYTALFAVVLLLRRNGFTVVQCLEANNEKLEKRTGKVFSREAVLNRDLVGEREILERHAGQAEQNPPAC